MKPPSGLRRGEHPSMTEGIGQFCEAIAPEHVLGPEGDSGAGFGHPRRQGVHGRRAADRTASALDFAWLCLDPQISSLASAKGPSVTLGFPRENETRVPIEGGWSPSSASSTPAFVSASLNFVISATISALGMAPGSAFSYPWGIISIMNRIVVPPSTPATIGGPRDRHGERILRRTAPGARNVSPLASEWSRCSP